MEEKFKCSKCGKHKIRNEFHETRSSKDKRPVAYHCKKCRSQRSRWLDVLTRQLKKFKFLCIECSTPRKLIKNQICKKCLEKRGLRQCTVCEEVLLKDLNFYKSKYQCKNCYGPKNS